MTGLIGLRCGDVADAVFPHNNDRRQRDKLALALVDLAHAVITQGIEARRAETQGGSVTRARSARLRPKPVAQETKKCPKK